MEIIVAKDIAEKDFERFGELNYLDFDLEGANEKDVASFESNKRVIVKAIMNGSLRIEDDGRATYLPITSTDKSPIKFNKPEGAHLMEMDRRDQKESVGKMMVLLGAITGQPAKRFANMQKNPDLNVCLAVGTLFLA